MRGANRVAWPPAPEGGGKTKGGEKPAPMAVKRPVSAPAPAAPLALAPLAALWLRAAV
jgi:hypothetical protein